MIEKFLEEVIILVAGKPAEKIASLLDDKKYVNEFTIAKKMDLTINQTRNILYKISDYGLVSFIRKKDKKKGWYTYFWKIETLKCLEFLKNVLLKKMDQLKHQIKSRETKQFYVCERCNIEFNEENALLHNFTCNECGGIFSMKDNSKVLKELNKALNKFDDKLKLIDIEIDKEKEKKEKKRLRELKKLEKEKKEKRAAARKKIEKNLKRKLQKRVRAVKRLLKRK